MLENDLRGLNLNLLVALDALLIEVSVTRAARRLHMTQSALSHCLAQLRELFSDPLLIRGTNGMLLTPRAVLLKEPLHRALAELAQLVRGEAEFDPSTQTREFSLAMGDAIILALLPPLLNALQERAPGVDLRMNPAPLSDWGRLLESGELDLGMTVASPDHPGLMSVRLISDSFVCLVRRGHPRVKAPLDLETYCSLPHALISPTGQARGVVDEKLDALGRSRRIKLVLNSFLIAPAVVSQSDLLLTAPRRMALALLGRYPLELLAPPLELPPFDIKMVWHERFDLDPASGFLRGLLMKIAASLPE